MWFWSCAVSVAATMIIGFTWGGWVAGRTATDAAQQAAQTAEAQLAASICVSRFENSADAATNLATLKKTSFWERSDFIRRDNWLKLPGVNETLPGAARLCADRLINTYLEPVKSTTMDNTPG
jgi:alpha/beta superfamily hydrolase